MSEIPEDLETAARVLNMRLHNAMELGQRTQWIAEALLTEREREQERCAKIAEDWSPTIDQLFSTFDEATEIAAAIRGTSPS